MTKKIKIEYWLYLFFMFQPLVNIYRTFFDDNLKVFGFSLFEMINIFFVIGLWLYLVFKQKNKKALYVIGYFVFLGGYCIIHYINMKQFNTEIFERSMYGLIQESYYIFRVYGIPVLLLTSLLCLKLKKEFFVRVIEDIALLVGSVIVVTNFLGVSFCTYGGEGHTYLINGSFFDWFHVTGAENMKMFTSIGWFGSGNEISGLLLMSLPVITYHFLQRGLKGAPRFIVSMLAMIMIGTKTATMGCILVFGLTGIIWLIVYATKKKFALVKKGGILFVCSVALCGFLFYYSPFLQNKYPHIKNASESTLEEIEQEQEEEEEIIEKNPIVLSAETKEDAEYAIDYIKNNYWRHYINSQFIENYPVEKDLSFWIDVANRDGGINQNYRFFKNS